MEPPQNKVSRRLLLTQALMGIAADWMLNLLYLRRAHGMEKMDPRRQCLYVSNHVSLLDTILLGGLFWRARCWPILVLGDKKVWSVTWLHRRLSRPIGFLVERGKLNPGRIDELQRFARYAQQFQLVVFPEGTRGNGVDVAECQPGIYHIAQTARVPIVPVFIANMQCVSTKTGKFHFFGGLKKVEVHYGDPVPPENYLSLTRDEFTALLRQKITALRPPQPEAHLSPVPLPGSIPSA